MIAVAGVLVCAAGATAQKRPQAPVSAAIKGTGATVNWSDGLIVARAGAAADLRAPTASIARIKAERTARRVAGEKALAAAASVALRPGLVADPKSAAWKSLATDLVTRSIVYTSDGSAIVEVGLPIESVRRAVARPDLAPPKRADGPTALVVDATGVSVAPVIGLTITAGDESYAGPVLYFKKSAPRQRTGSRATRLKASSHQRGALELGKSAASSLAAARSAGAPVFVLIK